MKLEGTLEEYPESRIDSIALKLRQAANWLDWKSVGISNGSVAFNFESPECDFERLNNLHAAGLLENKIDTVILGLTVDPGAVLRIESRIVDNVYESTIRYLPRIFGDGVWHSTRTQVNMDTGIIEKRLAAARREATDGRRVGTTAISALPSFTASSTHN